MQHILLLFIPGIAAGMINSVAGGGAILLYPALLTAGLSPLIANATSSLVVWPGALSSAYGYRSELKKVPLTFLWLGLPCIVGSIIGAFVLVHTNPHDFEKLVPWLILFAVALMALQSRIHQWLSLQSRRSRIHWRALPLVCVVTFPLAVYGGFFGAGFGLMMLALLGFTGLQNIHQMNGAKNLAAVIMALVATVYFWHAGLINFPSGLVMAAGTTFGGYLGSHLAQKIPAQLVHNLTIVIGLIISVVLLVKT